VIVPIDPSEPGLAERLVEIQRGAYAIEADLIGFDGIPQLTETPQQVRALGHMHWRAIVEDEILAALIAWEDTSTVIDIDRLAVDPAFARRGYGRRLVRSVPTDRPTIVSTGADNTPACRLYVDEGFTITGQSEIAPGVFTTQFGRPAT
jgi:ribosomal protein S18 acetylase RimI-like enzyme